MVVPGCSAISPSPERRRLTSPVERQTTGLRLYGPPNGAMLCQGQTNQGQTKSRTQDPDDVEFSLSHPHLQDFFAATS